MEEKVLFEQNDVKVTNARFVVGNKTTAINGVTSISTRISRPSVGGPIIGVLLGLVLLFSLEGAGKLIGLVIAGIAGYILYSQKPTHYIVLNSASGEVDAHNSKDELFINGIVAALNDALIHRG